MRIVWRRVTREWLAARRDVAEMHDSTNVDLHEVAEAAQRLEQAERRRAQIAAELQALHDRASEHGQPLLETPYHATGGLRPRDGDWQQT